MNIFEDIAYLLKGYWSFFLKGTISTINNIVHNAYFDCVDTTIINGEILMENKKI